MGQRAVDAGLRESRVGGGILCVIGGLVAIGCIAIQIPLIKERNLLPKGCCCQRELSGFADW